MALPRELAARTRRIFGFWLYLKSRLPLDFICTRMTMAARVIKLASRNQGMSLSIESKDYKQRQY